MSSKRSSGFATKTSYAFSFFAVSATCLAQLIILDLITRINFVSLEWPKLREKDNIKVELGVRTELFWLRIGRKWTWNWTFGLNKLRRIYRLAAEILALQARSYPLSSVNNRLTYLIRSTNHEIPQCAIFAGFLLLRTPWAQIFSSLPSSRKFTLLLPCYFFYIGSPVWNGWHCPRAEEIRVSFAPARTRFPVFRSVF